MDEQEHSATSDTPASGETGARDVITSRAAGWAVAAAMAGAVVGLSVAMATSSSPTVVVQPDGATGLRGTLTGAARTVAPGAVRLRMQTPVRVRIQIPAAEQVQGPARVRIQIPAAGRVQGPARLRIQIPAGGQVQGPARVRIQVPAARALHSPARLRLLPPVPEPAGTLIPLSSAAQAPPGGHVVAGVVAPRAVRLRVRPGQVRVRLRIQVPARARIQEPARAQIQEPAWARIVRALPAPPNS